MLDFELKVMTQFVTEEGSPEEVECWNKLREALLNAPQKTAHNSEHVTQVKSCQNCLYYSRCMHTGRVCGEWKNAFTTA